jgi:hypothetical protein
MLILLHPVMLVVIIASLPKATPKGDVLHITRHTATTCLLCRLHGWKVSRARVSIELHALDIDIAIMRRAPQFEQDKLAGPIERQRSDP